MTTIDDILDSTRRRLLRLGTQEAETLHTNLRALAKQHSLYLHEIDFQSPSLRITPESFGYGEEPTINVLNPFDPGVVGKGATVIYQPNLGETSLPAHDYQVARFTTPNIIIPPPAAAKLFANDKLVLATLMQLRQTFVDKVKMAISRAKKPLYGSVNVIPYDVIGSMTLVHEPELRTWKNLPGDLLGMRLDFYLGLTVLPGRAVAAEEDAAGADTSAPTQGMNHDDPRPN